MSFNYALAEHGATLATRPLGRDLRADLIEKADQSDVVLDFSGVLSASHSFADEFVARLAEERQSGHVAFAVSLSGLSPDVEKVVRKALERRDVAFPVSV